MVWGVESLTGIVVSHRLFPEEIRLITTKVTRKEEIKRREQNYCVNKHLLKTNIYS